jgi:hypothetical protein
MDLFWRLLPSGERVFAQADHVNLLGRQTNGVVERKLYNVNPGLINPWAV